nr:hypothetical protein [Tanacetum cinerariifolium]
MAYIIRQVKSSSIIKMNPYSVDKNDPNDVQLQNKDIMYDIASSVEIQKVYKFKRFLDRLNDDDAIAVSHEDAQATLLGRAGVVPAGLSFSTGGDSDIWWGIVKTIVSAMYFMMSCAGVPVRRSHGASCLFIFLCFVMEEMTVDINNFGFFLKVCAVLEYCYMWFEFHDAKLGQKWNDVLYMPNRYAYGTDVALDRYWHYVLFSISNKSLEQVMTSLVKCAELKDRVGGWEWADMMALYCVDAVVKTAEFLNDALWKDERRLQREIIEDLRPAREINALRARVTAIVDQREMFVDELDMLAGRHVPDKMADFM